MYEHRLRAVSRFPNRLFCNDLDHCVFDGEERLKFSDNAEHVRLT